MRQDIEKQGFKTNRLYWYRLVAECLLSDHVKGGGEYKNNNPLTTNIYKIKFLLFSEIHILITLDC